MTAAAPPTLQPASDRSGLTALLVTIGLMALLRLVVSFVRLPDSALYIATIVVSILFIAVPVLGFYRGASFGWTWKAALAMVIGGAVAQAGFAVAASALKQPVLGTVLMALSQTGLLVWCFGLGALVASAMKDKNVLLPVAIFLALFDIWLVFAPEGIASQAVSGSNPAIRNALEKLAIQVPAPGGYARPMAYIGPADMVFLAMFFVVLYRFRMRTKATFFAIVPTLAAYLLLVLLAGNLTVGPFRLAGLPALVPIGLVVLIVNWREFKLTKDELLSTIAVLVIGTALVTWRLVVSHKAQAERPAPSQRAPSRDAPTREEMRQLGPPA